MWYFILITCAITISGHIWLGREEGLFPAQWTFAFLCKRKRCHYSPFSVPIAIRQPCMTMLLRQRQTGMQHWKGLPQQNFAVSLGTELAVCVSGVFLQNKEKISTHRSSLCLWPQDQNKHWKTARFQWHFLFSSSRCLPVSSKWWLWSWRKSKLKATPKEIWTFLKFLFETLKWKN